MSFNPNGQPPPYHPGRPRPPPGSFTYVPAPVVMPMYPPVMPDPNPTYVNNYYIAPPAPSMPDQVQVAHHPQPPPVHMPEPVHVVNHAAPVTWIPSTINTAQTLAGRALVAGHEGWDGSQLWVIRAHHNGDLLPGKLAAKHRSAYVPFSRREVSVHNFDVLCAQTGSVRWIKCSHGQIPPRAVVGGHTASGETLYIGRVSHETSLTPGKIHPSHGCLYISYGGEEVQYKRYEVLCEN